MVIAATTLPIIDCGNRSQGRISLGKEVARACHEAGMFYLVNHGISRHLIDALMFECAQFFHSPEAEKQAISIKHSSNFRGWGVLKNNRDWREQIHLGMEADKPQVADPQAHYWRLWGRNQWPLTRTAEFKETTLQYFALVEELSRLLLESLALELDLKQDFFTCRMLDRPYLLIKAMSYLPQESTQQNANDMVLRPGVTAHCDWSWLTFLLQDDVGGLEAQDRSGQWHRVQPLPGAIVVNTGELLELESGGQLRASPHRVVNSRIDRQRFSVPLFVNPALDSMVYPTEQREASGLDCPDEHVHKVIKPGSQPKAFLFGESEWQRKGLGQWCYCKDCLD